MALPSGIYTIENVKYRNWAMLSNANEGEVVAGSSVRKDIGEKVSLLKKCDSTTTFNQTF
jgi:hypothetical protein